MRTELGRRRGLDDNGAVAQSCDLAVIGGGIIGLATAHEALLRSPRSRVLVLEKEGHLATHQTGRNSGVIHSGIYYKPGSLKARTCVAGARAMVEFCRAQGLPVRICGKVVVATSEDELEPLQELHRRGTANGVEGLELLDAARLRELEPHAAGLRALRVPGTGITDYAAVTRRLAELVITAGGDVKTGARVTGLEVAGDAVVIVSAAGEFRCRRAVNCAGLYADRLARLAGSDPGLCIVPFRGEYYELAPAARRLVNGLIYPVPDPRFPFLGVHFTLRLDGSVEAGPNAVLAFRREGYRRWDIRAGELWETLAYAGFRRMARRYWRRGLEEWRRSLSRRAFARSLQRLVPEVREEDLAAGGSGVRAQALAPDGALLDDFHIVRRGPMVHVLNVPSPAATASLAIARHIVDEAAA